VKRHAFSPEEVEDVVAAAVAGLGPTAEQVEAVRGLVASGVRVSHRGLARLAAFAGKRRGDSRPGGAGPARL